MLRSMIVLGLTALMSLTCLAQSEAGTAEKKPPIAQSAANAGKQFYHLNFVVQELENQRVINSRSYSMIAGDMGKGSIRAGEKVPVGTNTNWQMVHVGVDIDCRNLEVTPNGVSLDVKADISSMMEGSADSGRPTPPQPIIRNNQWESKVVLPLKQPSVLFSSDDPQSKRTMQLKLTVTPMR